MMQTDRFLVQAFLSSDTRKCERGSTPQTMVLLELFDGRPCSSLSQICGRASRRPVIGNVGTCRSNLYLLAFFDSMTLRSVVHHHWTKKQPR